MKEELEQHIEETSSDNDESSTSQSNDLDTAVIVEIPNDNIETAIATAANVDTEIVADDSEAVSLNLNL